MATKECKTCNQTLQLTCLKQLICVFVIADKVP